MTRSKNDEWEAGDVFQLAAYPDTYYVFLENKSAGRDKDMIAVLMFSSSLPLIEKVTSKK